MVACVVASSLASARICICESAWPNGWVCSELPSTELNCAGTRRPPCAARLVVVVRTRRDTVMVRWIFMAWSGRLRECRLAVTRPPWKAARRRSRGPRSGLQGHRARRRPTRRSDRAPTCSSLSPTRRSRPRHQPPDPCAASRPVLDRQVPAVRRDDPARDLEAETRGVLARRLPGRSGVLSRTDARAVVLDDEAHAAIVERGPYDDGVARVLDRVA